MCAETNREKNSKQPKPGNREVEGKLNDPKSMEEMAKEWEREFKAGR